MFGRIPRFVFAMLVVLACAVIISAVGPDTKKVSADDKDKKKIKITLKTELDHGTVPLPVHFVAQIVAPPELNEEIYKAGYEWEIMGKFVLTDPLTGGDSTPVDMRSRPMSSSEYMTRNTKHLVSRSRTRPPRKPYKPDMEI